MLVAATLAQRRYERELNRAERPILRKVLEGDAVSSRLMVLFVADVIEPADAPDAALMVEVRCGRGATATRNACGYNERSRQLTSYGGKSLCFGLSVSRLRS
jgi:hypothetical protein